MQVGCVRTRYTTYNDTASRVNILSGSSPSGRESSSTAPIYTLPQLPSARVDKHGRPAAAAARSIATGPATVGKQTGRSGCTPPGSCSSSALCSPEVSAGGADLSTRRCREHLSRPTLETTQTPTAPAAGRPLPPPAGSSAATVGASRVYCEKIDV